MKQMVNITEYARRRGVSREAVRKAVKSRRLVKSVTRDARGNVLLDPVIATREWDDATTPAKGKAYREALAGGPTVAAGFVAVERRLAAIVEQDLAERTRYVLSLVGPVVAGVVEALRSSGRQATTEAIQEALRLWPDDEDAGVELVSALVQLVDGEGPYAGAATADEGARAIGRDAVLGTKGGADVDQG